MPTAESAQSGLWSSTSTWIGGVVPGVGGAGYKAIIKGGHTVSLDQNIFIGDDRTTSALVIEDGGRLETEPGHPEYWLYTMGRVQVDGFLEATVLINIVDYIMAITFPSDYRLRIELRDGAGNLIYVFHVIRELTWDYLRNGGCYEARAAIRLPFATIDPLTILDYDFRVVIDDEAVDKVTWWRGSVVSAQRFLGDADLIQIEAWGMARYLENVHVIGLDFKMEQGAVFFENEDCTTIATALLDRVASWSDITYDGASAPISGVVLAHQEFNGNIYDAVGELARLAGDLEWAVDRNGTFYFVPKSSAAEWILIPGKDVSSGFSDSASLQGMVNRLYIVGQSNFVVEDDSDMSDDQSYTGTSSAWSFGKATTYQQTLQTFSTAAGTMSELEIQLRATGFTATNLLTNGDIETGDATGWTALTGRSVRIADTLAYAGTWGLKVRHNQTGKGVYGVYQDYTSATPGVLYKFTGRIKQPAWEGPVTVQLIDGSATPYPGNNTVLAEFTEARGLGGFWQKYSLAAEAVGTTIGIRVFAHNSLGGTGQDPFWIDDFWLTAGWDVEVAIIDPNHPDGPESDTAMIAGAEIAFDEIAVAPSWSAHTIKLFVYLESGISYGIRFKSLGPLSDTTYFDLRAGPGGYANGTLQTYDGASWTDQAPADAYFITRLPASIANYRLRTAMVRNPAIFGETEAGLLGAAMLATVGAPQRRAFVPLSANWRSMLEFAGPPMGTVKVHGLMSEALRPERISYRYDAENGIRADLELGMILPREADLLRRIEHKLSRLEAP